MESGDERMQLRSRVSELERIVGELLSHLILRETVHPRLLSWCDLSELLRQLSGDEQCEAVHEQARAFVHRLLRRAEDGGGVRGRGSRRVDGE